MEITWDDIERFSEQDVELLGVKEAVQTHRWPENLRKYEAHKKELHFLGNLVFKSESTVLPKALRTQAMNSAHGGHVGEVAMKRIMRRFFWWPGMSQDVIRFVKSCDTCAVLSRKNPPIPLSSRELPEGPWEIIQIDFLSIPGTGVGTFLAVVDTYSRHLSVIEMGHTDADSTNKALCQAFRTWGCPAIIQSDNGPPFQSTAFIEFWEKRGVKVRKSIPLCPQTNGIVERQNQGLIKAVAAAKLDGVNWRQALQNYVHNHNTIIPHSRLGVTPFELLVGWRYRGTFPSLWSDSGTKVVDRLDIRERDSEAKHLSKLHADAARGARESNIDVGDTVLMAQQKKTKVDPTFSSEPFTVIAREGAKVVVVNRGGVQYSRNVQDVRKYPSHFSTEETVNFEDQLTELQPIVREESIISPENFENSNTVTLKIQSEMKAPSRVLRQRGNIRKPSRFDDNFLYTVYC